MSEGHKRLFELLLLVPAFGFLIPPASSTGEAYSLLPGLAFGAAAFAGSLAIAVWRNAETRATAGIKMLLFLAFGWILHVRVGIS